MVHGGDKYSSPVITAPFVPRFSPCRMTVTCGGTARSSVASEPSGRPSSSSRQERGTRSGSILRRARERLAAAPGDPAAVEHLARTLYKRGVSATAQSEFREAARHLAAAVARVVDGKASGIIYCREKLQLPADQLNPPALITGNDLIALGLPPGRAFKIVLDAVRDAQLLGELSDKPQALDMAKRLWEQHRG